MNMNQLPPDVVWKILRILPAYSILTNRSVTSAWKHTIDDTSQHDWKLIYKETVCKSIPSIPFSQSFDWKRCTVLSSIPCFAVDAVCVWNLEHVRVVVPWKYSEWCDATGAPLKVGVRRFHVDDYNIDFIY